MTKHLRKLTKTSIKNNMKAENIKVLNLESAIYAHGNYRY